MPGVPGAYPAHTRRTRRIPGAYPAHTRRIPGAYPARTRRTRRTRRLPGVPGAYPAYPAHTPHTRRTRRIPGAYLAYPAHTAHTWCTRRIPGVPGAYPTYPAHTRRTRRIPGVPGAYPAYPAHTRCMPQFTGAWFRSRAFPSHWTLAQRADAGVEDDVVGLGSWLTFGGCFAWLLAAVVTARPKSKFCTFNHGWIWVPLASCCCALVVQPRPYEVGPSRLGIASAAVSATRCQLAGICCGCRGLRPWQSRQGWCFGADLAGKSLLDYLSPEDHHSFLLLLHSELWQLRSIIVRRVRNLCVSARGRFRF